MASLCHPWFTRTNLSYRLPIFETSATALCGTTGSKSNNQPAVGDGLLPLISGKIGDGLLFWSVLGVTGSGFTTYSNHSTPFSLPVAVRTCQIQESWAIQTIQRKWSQTWGTYFLQCRVNWKNSPTLKSDSVNLWPIQPWLLLQLGFLPYPPNSDHFLRVTGGWFADGVGGAAAGVNGFLASENSGTSTWIGAKRAKRYIKCIRLQLLPSGGFSIGKITSHLKQAQVNEKTQHLPQRLKSSVGKSSKEV